MRIFTPLHLAFVAFVLVTPSIAAGPNSSAFVLREGKARTEIANGSRGTDEWSISSYKRWLYDGTKKLGRIDYVSISPSGRFALLQFKQRLTLYDRDCACRPYVNKSYYAFPLAAIWDEKAGWVRVPGTMLTEPYEILEELALPTRKLAIE